MELISAVMKALTKALVDALGAITRLFRLLNLGMGQVADVQMKMLTGKDSEELTKEDVNKVLERHKMIFGEE
ncbi:hypothetical protein MOMA_06901 [Moraxella macacae 0408225]|uniref:Uncharacterized protein n=1 Tax=Moraxella macacae 0408225 TaxID=1230338 RepID=L2F5U4_9GAMM|nr:hypothetical protein [Moraxella macacae]ELA08270.1 hypothetical protein MOMA_06901 [Moraxella macacae 0408225]